MGREVRRVPPHWNHPKDARGNYLPMHDEHFDDAAREWKEGLAKWDAGERPEYYSSADKEPMEYWEYGGMPPEREFYRPWRDEEATWFQVWETVTEGTPVTPPFATAEELIDHLVVNGDEWDEGRGWERSAAESFVGSGWAPSIVMIRSESGPKIYAPRDGSPL